MKDIPLDNRNDLNLRDVARYLLDNIDGENPYREGLKDTPKRFASAIEFLTTGYKIEIEDVVRNALFLEPRSEYVLVKDIEFYSLCEHHLLPFMGKIHIAYIPDGKVIGLSKIPRAVEVFSRRLQVQERLTSQLAEELSKVIKPKGIAVYIEASHMCMMMRGVQKQHSSTITRIFLGCFKSDANLQKEFLAAINKL